MDVRKLAGDGFEQLDAGRQVPLLGFDFQYYLGGRPKPARKTTILIPLLQPAALSAAPERKDR
jgi:hypothetical protein